MELILKVVLVVSLFVINLISNCAGNTKDLNLICYYFSWSRYYVNPMAYFPKNIPVELCDEIVYYRSQLNETNFTIQPSDQYADVDEGDMLKVTNLGSNKTKVMLAIGGYHQSLDGFSNLHLQFNREIFYNSTLEFLKKYNFRGVVIDWLHPDNNRSENSINDINTYVTLVKELRRIFKRLHYKLVISGPHYEAAIDRGYDVPKLSKYVDAIHVRSFNFWGWWEKEAYHHNQLRTIEKNLKDTTSVESIMALWESKGAPKNKLVVGVALEGITSQLVQEDKGQLGSRTEGRGTKHKYSDYAGGILYYELCSYIMSGSWIEKWDKDGMVPYAHSAEPENIATSQVLKAMEWATFENPRSAAAKAEFAKEKGYNGIFLYSVTVDDFRGLCGPKNGISCAVKKVLSSKPINTCI